MDALRRISRSLRRSGGSTVHDFARENDVMELDKAVKKMGPQVLSSKNDEGDTPLHIAALLGFSGLVEQLVLHGADANTRNNKGETCLHCGCKAQTGGNSRLDIMRLLITDAKADCLAVSNGGLTPLHLFVAESQSSELDSGDSFCSGVDLILQNGGDINEQSKSGETALHFAIKINRFPLVKALITRGSDPNISDKQGETSLQLAIRLGFEDMALFFLENGADTNIVNRRGSLKNYCDSHNARRVSSKLSEITRSQSGSLTSLSSALSSTSLHHNTASSSSSSSSNLPIQCSTTTNLGSSTEGKKRLEIDPDLVASLETKGYETSKIMVAIYSLHKRGLAFDNENDVKLEIDNGTATNLSECRICFTDDINSVLLPCSHASFCLNCARDLKSNNSPCPICRADIDQVIPFFQV